MKIEKNYKKEGEGEDENSASKYCMINENYISIDEKNQTETAQTAQTQIFKKNYIIENWDMLENEFLDGKKALLISDLKKSGLAKETIIDAKLEIFEGSSDDLKNLIGFSSIDKQSIVQASSILKIPYFDKSDNIIYYRLRLYPPLNNAKYLSPRDSESIPYIPTSTYKIQSKRNKDIWICEGEKKALSIQQCDEYTIGLQGVWNFRRKNKETGEIIQELQNEIVEFCIPGRTFNLAFDSDFLSNQNVRHALYLLALTLYLKFNVVVRIAQWNEKYKGIDDYLAAGGDISEIKAKALPILSFIEKFQEFSDSLMYSLRELNFEPGKAVEFPALKLISSITKIGITRTALKEYLRQETKERKKEQLIVDGYIMPSGFGKNGNKLSFSAAMMWQTVTVDICDYFIVDKIIHAKNNTFLNLKFNDKEFKADANIIGDGKELAKTFNENGIFVLADEAKKISKFIKIFLDINDSKISEINEYDHIGYDDKTNKYLAPTVNIDSNILFTNDINLKIQRSGDSEKQIDFLRRIFLNHIGASFIISAGLASLLVKPLNLNNFVVFTSGRTGTGKTIANQIMLSMFGNPDRLKHILNSTTVGAEILFYKFLDFPILLDELETANNTAEKINNSLVNIIYGFQSGIGRTRSQKNLQLRETSISRGLLFITSERSISSVLSDNSTQKANLGIYRRVLEINDKVKLFNNANYAEIVNEISKTYGHVLPLWVVFIKNNLDMIKMIFMQIQNENNIQCGGKQDIISLIYICRDLFSKNILNINSNIEEFKNVATTILNENISDFQDNVLNEYEKYQNSIKEFAMTSGRFLNKIQEKKKEDNYRKPLAGIIGQIESKCTSDDNHILYFYTNKAVESLCKEYKFEQKRLIELLKQKGILVSGDSKGKFTTQKKIDGNPVRCYCFKFNNAD